MIFIVYIFFASCVIFCKQRFDMFQTSGWAVPWVVCNCHLLRGFSKWHRNSGLAEQRLPWLLVKHQKFRGSFGQWEFQDPKMELVYHMFGHILWGYSLT